MSKLQGLYVSAGVVLIFAAFQSYDLPASTFGYGASKADRVQKKDSALKLAAGRGAGKTGHSKEVRRLIAAAKDRGERELNFTSYSSTLGGNRGVKMYEALFNRLYKMNVKINFIPGVGYSRMAAKLMLEVPAGEKPSTDFFVGSYGNFAGLLNRRVLEEYDYSKLSPRITKELVAPKNIGVEFESRIPGITYNTNIISPGEVPKKLEDVLNPKWKGKIASTTTGANFEGVAALPEWGAQKTKVFLTKLSENIGGLIRCGELSRVASGEFIMLVIDCGGQDAHMLKEKGAPVAHVIPKDAAFVNANYLGVPRHSAHPNLAKLFINTVLSEEGQRLLFKLHSVDHYALPGSQSVSAVRNLKVNWVNLLKMDAKFYAKHPEMGRLGKEFRKILRKKSGG